MRKPCTRLFSLILIVLMLLSLFALPALASEEALSVASAVLEAVETESAEETAPVLATAETAAVEENETAEESETAEDAPVLAAGAAPTTHDELAAALAAGGEVTLAGDIALSGTLTVPAGTSVVLDLNGHALTGYKFATMDVCGELTIRDSVGTGSVTTTGGAVYESYFTITAQAGSTLTIEGGSFSGSGVISAFNSNITITGGTFIQNANAGTAIFTCDTCTLTIAGGDFRNLGSADYGGSILYTYWTDTTITGGTFTDASPNGMFFLFASDAEIGGGSFTSALLDFSYLNSLNITGGDFTADSILFPPGLTIAGGDFTADSITFPSEPSERSITGGTFLTSAGARQPDTLAALAVEYYMDEQGKICYEPLPDNTEELAAALAAGGEVVLPRDVELTETLVVPAGSEAVLELNGHALTAMDFTLLDVRGKLTVRDSVGTGSMHATFIDDPDDPYDRAWTITSQEGAVLIIESGSFSGGTITIEPRGGDITINGGTFIGDSVIPVGGKYCTMTINGGTFRSNYGGNVLAPQEANLTINGGTFELIGSGSVFHSYDASVTIEDGTFSGNEISFMYGKDVTINGGTFTCEEITFPGDSSVTGGVFTLLEIARFIIIDDTVVHEGEPFLTGGTFLDPNGAVLPVDKHIVEGYYQDTDGAVRFRVVGGNTTTPPVPTESPVPSESPVPTEEPQPSARPETTPKPQPTKAPAPTAPATGDDSPVALWAAVLVFCAAVLWLPVRAPGKKR